jgi:DNA-directed RNA polymerase subunit RPC12/RpoP
VDFGKFIEAGMTDANGNESILTGSLPFGHLSVPRHIDLVGNNLYWRDDPLDDYKWDSANDTGALNAFVRIETPDDILRFARRYGPLGLCKHGRPPMHRGRDLEPKWCAPCGSEPAKRWLDYVGLASSYLNLAAVLKVDTGKHMRGLRQLFLRDGINEWLGDAGIRLELNWSSNDPTLTLTGGGVFGALGVQLLSAVTANNLAVCSGCGKPYLREGRKPQAGRRNFCPVCGDKVANRLRVRARRNKKGGK